MIVAMRAKTAVAARPTWWKVTFPKRGVSERTEILLAEKREGREEAGKAHWLCRHCGRGLCCR